MSLTRPETGLPNPPTLSLVSRKFSSIKQEKLLNSRPRTEMTPEPPRDSKRWPQSQYQKPLLTSIRFGRPWSRYEILSQTETGGSYDQFGMEGLSGGRVDLVPQGKKGRRFRHSIRVTLEDPLQREICQKESRERLPLLCMLRVSSRFLVHTCC